MVRLKGQVNESKAEMAESVARGCGAFCVATIGVQLGIKPDFDQSAAYLKSWLRALQDEKDLIFKAAAEAQKAVDYLNEAVGHSKEDAPVAA